MNLIHEAVKDLQEARRIGQEELTDSDMRQINALLPICVLAMEGKDVALDDLPAEAKAYLCLFSSLYMMQIITDRGMKEQAAKN